MQIRLTRKQAVDLMMQIAGQIAAGEDVVIELPDATTGERLEPKMLYAKFRPDGFPLCPNCGMDELWSDAGAMLPRHIPTMDEFIQQIVSCYNCHWSPEMDDLDHDPTGAVTVDGTGAIFDDDD